MEGSGHALGSQQLACETSTYLERIYLMRAPSVADAEALSRRVQALEEVGRSSHPALTRAQAAAARWTMPGTPQPAPEPASYERPVSGEEWRELAGHAKEVETRAKALGRATCASFPGITQALGGASACESRMTVYYLGHCPIEIGK